MKQDIELSQWYSRPLGIRVFVLHKWLFASFVPVRCELSSFHIHIFLLIIVDQVMTTQQADKANRFHSHHGWMIHRMKDER